MKFKMIIALVTEEKSDTIIDCARHEGATGCTVITTARGEGVRPAKTFFGLGLETHRDVILFVVEEHLSRHILESIATVGRFDEELGSGIAIQLDVEDAVGLISQLPVIKREIEDQI